MYDLFFKLFLIGDLGVGKICVFFCFLDDVFNIIFIFIIGKICGRMVDGFCSCKLFFFILDILFFVIYVFVLVIVILSDRFKLLFELVLSWLGWGFFMFFIWCFVFKFFILFCVCCCKICSISSVLELCFFK